MLCDVFLIVKHTVSTSNTGSHAHIHTHIHTYIHTRDLMRTNATTPLGIVKYEKKHILVGLNAEWLFFFCLFCCFFLFLVACRQATAVSYYLISLNGTITQNIVNYTT